MIAIGLALLPVFLVIIAGLLLTTSGLVQESQWSGVNHVCYFVLFPAIIFKEIAAADFAGLPIWRMAFAMILALMTMFAVLLASRRILSTALALDGPQFSSVFQGATRWHTFIAFAIIPLLFGRDALALGAVAAAAMTPLLNVANIAVISLCATGHPPDPKKLAVSILRNPFFISSAAGVAYKLTALPFPSLALITFDMVGRGALGLALLTAGAGLRLGEPAKTAMPIALATALKLAVMPLFTWAWLEGLGVTGTPAAVAVLCTGVPTGAGAYVLARHLGGDAPLVASIMTVQVICAAITLPIVLALLR
jgi:malonate transporter and related proteins